MSKPTSEIERLISQVPPSVWPAIGVRWDNPADEMEIDETAVLRLDTALHPLAERIRRIDPAFDGRLPAGLPAAAETAAASPVSRLSGGAADG